MTLLIAAFQSRTIDPIFNPYFNIITLWLWLLAPDCISSECVLEESCEEAPRDWVRCPALRCTAQHVDH